jgi:hypothetical protein
VPAGRRGQQERGREQQCGAEAEPCGGRDRPRPCAGGDQGQRPAQAGGRPGGQQQAGGAPARGLPGVFAYHEPQFPEFGQRGAGGFLVTGSGGAVLLVGLDQAVGCLVGDGAGSWRCRPLFSSTMTLGELYRYPTRHFWHHRRQLTLPEPVH